MELGVETSGQQNRLWTEPCNMQLEIERLEKEFLERFGFKG